MTPSFREQRNPYKGGPPRAWIQVRLVAPNGITEDLDLHATLLALLGLDHENLTNRYAGREFRLVDVAGNVVQGIFT